MYKCVFLLVVEFIGLEMVNVIIYVGMVWEKIVIVFCRYFVVEIVVLGCVFVWVVVLGFFKWMLLLSLGVFVVLFIWNCVFLEIYVDWVV